MLIVRIITFGVSGSFDAVVFAIKKKMHCEEESTFCPNPSHHFSPTSFRLGLYITRWCCCLEMGRKKEEFQCLTFPLLSLGNEFSEREGKNVFS